MPSFDLDGFEGEQEYLIEVWIEKSTQNDWLVPLCRKHNVNLVVGVGELSEIACRHLVQRIDLSGKPARILYLSDFDPGGRSMPVAVARKMEFYLNKWEVEADVKLWPRRGVLRVRNRRRQLSARRSGESGHREMDFRAVRLYRHQHARLGEAVERPGSHSSTKPRMD